MSGDRAIAWRPVVDDAGTADGTRVQIAQSGKCPDASGGTRGDRVPVHLWACHTGTRSGCFPEAHPPRSLRGTSQASTS